MESYTTSRAMHRPVPDGPRAYRSRIRAGGPLVAMLVPGVFGVLAVGLLFDNEAAARGIGGFLAALLAAPVLPMLGVPFRSGSSVVLIGIGASAVVWFAIGMVAARRATRAPIATWRDFWRQYLWLAAGVWVGVVLALGASNLVLGRAVL